MTAQIHTALAAVMADCKGVAKRDRNDHQRFMFRGIDAVVNAVGPILREHQVTVVPLLQSVTYDTVHTTNGKPSTACRVVVTYRFSTVDGSHLDTTVAAEAWDSGDKSTPKAMSVAFRTALLQALALPTDEPDPDSHTYEQAPQRKVASAEQLAQLGKELQEAGVTEIPAFINQAVGRPVAGFADLSVEEAAQVLHAVREYVKAPA